MYIISLSHFPLIFYHFYPISTQFLPFLPKIPYFYPISRVEIPFYPISTIGRVEIPNYPVKCHPCPDAVCLYHQMQYAYIARCSFLISPDAVCLYPQMQYAYIPRCSMLISPNAVC